MIEKQELHCHNCSQYVQFVIDTELNGNHVLECPVCGHEHCRVVKDGEITEDRWDSRNPSYQVSSSSITYTTTSTYSTYSSSTSNSTVSVGNYGTDVSFFLYNSWMNSSGTY